MSVDTITRSIPRERSAPAFGLRIADCRLRTTARSLCFAIRHSLFASLSCCALLLAAGPAPAQELFVADGDAVWRFDGETGASLGQFNDPNVSLVDARGLVFGVNGNLFVAGATSPHYPRRGIIEYDGWNGWRLRRFDGGGVPSDVESPRGLAFRPYGDGNLLVACLFADAVHEFRWPSGDPEGAFASGDFCYPTGITFGPNGNLFVSCIASAAVLEYDGADGTLIGTFASGGGLTDPRDLVFGPNGNLLVASFGTDEVIEYDGSSGALVGTFASGGGLDGPIGVTFGANGNLFVVSSLSAEVIEYDGTTGALVGTFASGEMIEPTYLVFGPCRWYGCPAPTLTGFSPSEAGSCGTLWGATVTGANLELGAEIRLQKAGHADIVGLVRAIPQGTSIVADFELAGAAAGLWGVKVKNLDGQSATLAGALEVVPNCPPPVVTGIEPAEADNCFPQTLVYEIFGADFLAGAEVRLELAGESDLVATNVEVLASDWLIADFFEMGALAGGLWDVVVTNPDEQSATLPGGLAFDDRDDCPEGEAYDWVHWEQCVGWWAGLWQPQFDSEGNLVVIRHGQRFVVGGGRENFFHVLKISPAGEVLCETPNLHGEGPVGRLLHIDADDNIFLSGNYCRRCDDPNCHFVFVRKYDADFNLLWHRDYELPWPVGSSTGGGMWGALIPGGDLYLRFGRYWQCTQYPWEVRRLRIRVSDGELLDWYDEPLTGVDCGYSDNAYFSVFYHGADADGCYYTLEGDRCGFGTIRKYCGSELIWDRPDLPSTWSTWTLGGVLYEFTWGGVLVEGKLRPRVRRLDGNGDEVWSQVYTPPDPNHEFELNGTRYGDHPARLDRQGNIVLLVERNDGLAANRHCSVLRIRPADGQMVSWTDLEGMVHSDPTMPIDTSIAGVDAVGNVFIPLIDVNATGGGRGLEARVKCFRPDGSLLRELAWNYPRRFDVTYGGGSDNRVYHTKVGSRGDLFSIWDGGPGGGVEPDWEDPCDLNQRDIAILGVVSPYVIGDFDGDGEVTLADRDVFVAVLLGLDTDPVHVAQADMNADGTADGEDIQPFVNAVLGITPPPPIGACCQDDGTCAETTQPSCVGQFMGVGTTCDTVTCPEPGACCYADGSCAEVPPWLCSGQFQGEGTSCDTGTCPTGACCLPDGSCEEMMEWACELEDGLYQGDDTTCATVECPPAGACCSPVGVTCTMLIEAACDASGGAYQGDGIGCDPNPCPGGRYSNEIYGTAWAIAAGNGLQLADDMTLEGVGVRELVYLDLVVWGNGGGTFVVTVSLWTDCPGNGGTLIPDTTFTWTGVPDDGYAYILTADPVTPAVTIPDTVWMVAEFSTPQATWIIAEEAEIGFTEDIFGRNDPPWACNYYFFGDPYAGLWANLICQEGGGKADGGRISPRGFPPTPGNMAGLDALAPEEASGTRLRMIKLETVTQPVVIEAVEVTK